MIDKNFAIFKSELRKYGDRGQATTIAQFLKLVEPGIIDFRHIFSGLERPLCCDDNMKADEDKLIYTSKPVYDYVWEGTPHDGDAIPYRPPAHSVFVIIISPNINHRGIYPTISGWINRWNWVPEDSGLNGAPYDWVDRYKEKIYTKI